MNTKQLTNVLVKIVGLDLCGHAAPTLVAVVWLQFENLVRGGGSLPMLVNLFATNLAIPLTSVVLGVFLILASRAVTNWLFNNEPQEP